MEVLKTRPDITDLVRNVAQEQGINNCTITEVKTNSKGEGYLGQIFMITVVDTESKNQLNVVIKAAFTEDKVRDMAPIQRCFENEGFFYSEIYPAFNKFEKSRGITQTVELVPKCYRVFIDNHKEMLCMEDLKKMEFEIFNKKLILDHEHVSLIFKKYGRFHAYSFALNDQRPEEYSRLANKLCNIYDELIQNESTFFPSHFRELSKLVQQYFIPGEDDEIIKKFEKYVGEGMVTCFQDIVTAKCEPSIIVHGDCWSNNMMFKYKNTESGKIPTDLRLFDWQLAKVGSPACDLSYCFYSGASKECFDRLDEYLKIYYESFSSFLKELGSDPDKLFPFDVLKQHWRKYAKFGMMMALMVVKMKVTYQEDIIDFSDDFNEDEVMELLQNMRFDEEGYKKRIRDIFYHLSEIDAL